MNWHCRTLKRHDIVYIWFSHIQFSATMLQFKDSRLVKFGEHITKIRKTKGMEPTDISKNCTLSVKDIMAIEKGSKNFGFTTFLELAKGLGINPGDLFDVDLSK
jgi:hypothetical protein